MGVSVDNVKRTTLKRLETGWDSWYNQKRIICCCLKGQDETRTVNDVANRWLQSWTWNPTCFLWHSQWSRESPAEECTDPRSLSVLCGVQSIWSHKMVLSSSSAFYFSSFRVLHHLQYMTEIRTRGLHYHCPVLPQSQSLMSSSNSRQCDRTLGPIIKYAYYTYFTWKYDTYRP